MKITAFWDIAPCSLVEVDRTNVVIESLTLLFRIRDVPVSNLSPETSYPD
jgi:hypothetical protein